MNVFIKHLYCLLFLFSLPAYSSCQNIKNLSHTEIKMYDNIFEFTILEEIHFDKEIFLKIFYDFGNMKLFTENSHMKCVLLKEDEEGQIIEYNFTFLICRAKYIYFRKIDYNNNLIFFNLTDYNINIDYVPNPLDTIGYYKFIEKDGKNYLEYYQKTTLDRTIKNFHKFYIKAEARQFEKNLSKFLKTLPSNIP